MAPPGIRSGVRMPLYWLKKEKKTSPTSQQELRSCEILLISAPLAWTRGVFLPSSEGDHTAAQLSAAHKV